MILHNGCATCCLFEAGTASGHIFQWAKNCDVYGPGAPITPNYVPPFKASLDREAVSLGDFVIHSQRDI